MHLQQLVPFMRMLPAVVITRAFATHMKQER